MQRLSSWDGNVRRPRTCVLVTVAMLCGGAGALSDARAALAHCHTAPGPWVTTSTPPDTSLVPTTEESANQQSQGHVYLTPSSGGVGLAVDPANSKDLFYANSRQVFRTLDGGCTWQLALSLDSTPAAASSTAQVVASADQLYSITSMAVASTSALANHETVYVVATDTDVNQTTLDELPTLFMVSTDGGATFQQPQALPNVNAPNAPEGTPTCENTTLAVAPSDPRTAYLQCEQARLVELELCLYCGFVLPLVTNETPFFVTHDAGQSWTQVSSPLTLLANQPVQQGDSFLFSFPQPAQPDFIVDPRHPNTLWTTQLQTAVTPSSVTGGPGPSYLWRSTDSGATWTKVFSPYAQTAQANASLVGVDAEYSRSGAERIVTWARDTNGKQAQAYLSLNGGKSWMTLPPVPLTAIPKVNHALQAWADPPFEDVTFAAGANDILAIMNTIGDYGQPGASCSHPEAVRYNIARRTWLPVPTPKEAVADPHGINLAWPASDHRGLATTTYYATPSFCTYASGSQAPMLLSYTDHTKS